MVADISCVSKAVLSHKLEIWSLNTEGDVKSLQPSSPISQTPNGNNRTGHPHMAHWKGKRRCPRYKLSMEERGAAGDTHKNWKRCSSASFTKAV
jgi:hypothetical protein